MKDTSGFRLSLSGYLPRETALYEELNAWTNMSFHAVLMM